jgi:hypothetical protein
MVADRGSVGASSAWSWRYPALAAVAFVAIYGLRTADFTEFAAITSDPLRITVASEYQFLYGSPLTFFVGNYYRHHGLDAFAAFVVIELLGAALLVVALRRALRGPSSSTTTMILMSSPLLFVLTFFIGKSDVFLVACFLLLTVTESGVTACLLCVLMVSCHREMAAAMLIGYLCLEPERWAPVVAGLAIGEGSGLIYTDWLLQPPPVSRVAYAIAHTREHWRLVSTFPMLHLLATLGPFWIYAVTRRRLPLAAIAVAGGAFALAAGTVDFTRVFVIVSLPLLLEIAKDAAHEVERHGGLVIGRRVVSVHALWPLVFLQVNVAGPKLFWARGIEWVFGR